MKKEVITNNWVITKDKAWVQSVIDKHNDGVKIITKRVYDILIVIQLMMILKLV